MSWTRADAAERDAHDPLARCADQFVVPDPSLVYLDGNSLGRLPRRTEAALAEAVTRGWGGRLVRGWSEWIDLPHEVGDRLGRAVLGAAPGQVVVCDSTTVNLFKLIAAAVDVRPDRRVLVTDDGNFPTDRYVVEGIARQRGLDVRWVKTDPIHGVQPDQAGTAIDEDVAMATFSYVDFRSGAVADIVALTDLVHAAGGLVLWDLSHAAGSVPVELDRWGVDLAVGCTYKYLNGGPGAPAWLYVRREWQERLAPPVWGWFGHADQFGMGSPFRAAAGMARWLAGTPPVLGLVAVDEGVAMIEEVGMDHIRAKGLALTSYAASLADAWLRSLGFVVASPADASKRGSHLAFRHPEAYRLSRALVDAGVIGDFRPPDVVRLGFSPLSTRFTDVWDGLDRLRQLAAGSAWTAYDPTPERVT